MTEISAAIQELPLQSWIPILVLVVIGLALWLAGGRLLRAAFAGLGLVVGGGGGWLLGNAVNFGVSPWVITVVGALLLACVATLAYRAAVAAGLALVLAVAAPLGVWTVADPTALEQVTETASDVPEPASEPEEVDPIDEFVQDVRDRWYFDPEAEQEEEEAAELWPEDVATTLELQEQVNEHLEQARTFAEQLFAQARAVWEQTPPELRDRLVAAAVVGALIGFLVGTLATSFSTSVATAFAGALMWMIGAWSGVTRIGVPDGPWIPSTPNAWLTWWVIISVIGLVIQWTTRPKRADKPA